MEQTICPKRILVIGSAVADVVIQLPRLPKTGEDVHVRSQRLSMGGCAYNVSDILRRFGVPHLLFAPVGTGPYGDFVRGQLRDRGIPLLIPTPARDNGCCYCFVEPGGERTFLSYHGAEYAFEADWFQTLQPADYSCAYLCGLEIEEPTGGVIVDFVERSPALPIFFAPGPRLAQIDRSRMERLFALHPILHLNEGEALAAAAAFCSETAATWEQALPLLARLTGNTVIVTLGGRGCCCLHDGKVLRAPAVPAAAVDTTGAGDAHAGAVLAALARGASPEAALGAANRVAAAVVGTAGAQLSDAAFQPLMGIL